MKKRHQVVIVGGGPVGVALAVELGLRGISCALIERRLTPQRIPKGQGLSPALDGALLCLGRRRQGARGAAVAARFSNQGRHRVPQPHERVLVCAGGARGRRPLLLPGVGAAAAISHRRGAACAHGGTPHCRKRIRLDRADRRAGRAGSARHDREGGRDRAHDARSGLCGRLRWRAFDGAPASRHRARRYRFRSAHGARRHPLARAARRLQALSAALDIPGDASRSEGLLDVLRSRRPGREFLFPCAGAARHHARQLRFSWADAARRRLQLRLRVRLCRFLGSAHRGRREIPGRPRLHRRRRCPQPSALWRLRPQQRPRRRRQSRLEARRAPERLGQRRAA